MANLASNVAPLRPAAAKAHKAAVKAPGVKAARARRRQAVAGYLNMGVAVALTGLSLTHLSRGIEMVTGCGAVEAMLMAVGFDAGFLSVEFTELSIGERLARQTAVWSKSLTLGMIGGSMALNSLAWLDRARDGLGWQAAAIALGIATPAMIYGLTRLAARTITDAHART